MKKLILDLGDIAVESFQTTAEAQAGGTVLGHETEVANCTLGNTCGQGGPGTCYAGGCGGGSAGCEQTNIASCACVTNSGCADYPSTSCPPGVTEGEATCYCIYQKTDWRVCCSDAAACTGGGMC